MAGLAAAGFEILGYDTLAPVFSVTHEAAAMGCAVDWGRKDAMPTVSAPRYESAGQIEIPSNFLRHSASTVVLEALRRLKRQYPHVALLGKVFGPWTLAYHLFGVERFLMLTIDDPLQVREIIRRLTPLPILFAQAQFEAGADAITLGDHASADMISEKMYKEFLYPAHCILAREIKGPVILHTCGQTADRLADFAHTGFACFHFDSVVTPKRAREIVDAQPREASTRRRKIALMGSINNPEVLLQGTPAGVREAVAECLRQQIEIIAPECAVPLATPTQNLKALSQAVRDATSSARV